MDRALWQARPSGTTASAYGEELWVPTPQLEPGQTPQPLARGLAVILAGGAQSSSAPQLQVLFLVV